MVRQKKKTLTATAFITINIDTSIIVLPPSFIAIKALQIGVVVFVLQVFAKTLNIILKKLGFSSTICTVVSIRCNSTRQ